MEARGQVHAEGCRSGQLFQAGHSDTRLACDGNEVIEVDALNLVRLISGKDQMADIRSAIGL